MGVVTSFAELKALGYLMKEYIQSIESSFAKDNKEQELLCRATFENLQSQINSIGQTLFARIKSFRNTLDLENIYNVLTKESHLIPSSQHRMTID